MASHFHPMFQISMCIHLEVVGNLVIWLYYLFYIYLFTLALLELPDSEKILQTEKNSQAVAFSKCISLSLHTLRQIRIIYGSVSKSTILQEIAQLSGNRYQGSSPSDQIFI